MSRGVNKAIIVGNLGRDPEIRYAASGSPIANVSIATTESWKDKQTGENTEKTEWHRVVFFGKLAEIVGEYLKKGSQVYVEGRLQTRKWQDQNGQDRYSTEIVANDMQMLGGRGAGGAPAENFDQTPQAAASTGGGATAPAGVPTSDFDDDIPF